MGINECSLPASNSSWDSQDFGDVSMVLKMAHFRKSTRPQWVNKMLPKVLMLNWVNIGLGNGWGGGGVYWIHLVRPSVRPSVCL